MVHDSIAPGALRASLAAGAIFLPTLVLVYAYCLLPAAIPVPGQELLGALILLPLGCVFGFFLAILPNLIGSALLAALGDHVEAARLPAVWILTGALAGAVLGWLVDARDGGSTALAITGALNAALCRRGLAWHEGDRLFAAGG